MTQIARMMSGEENHHYTGLVFEVQVEKISSSAKQCYIFPCHVADILQCAPFPRLSVCMMLYKVTISI